MRTTDYLFQRFLEFWIDLTVNRNIFSYFLKNFDSENIGKYSQSLPRRGWWPFVGVDTGHTDTRSSSRIKWGFILQYRPRSNGDCAEYIAHCIGLLKIPNIKFRRHKPTTIKNRNVSFCVLNVNLTLVNSPVSI